MIDRTHPPAPPAPSESTRGSDIAFKVAVTIYFIVAALVALYSLGIHGGVAIAF